MNTNSRLATSLPLSTSNGAIGFTGFRRGGAPFRRRRAFSNVIRPGIVESRRGLLSATVAVALAILLAGCAYNRPLFSEQIVATNGVITTRSLSVRTFALWPATTQLDKQRASLGKTMSLGTTGLNEDSGATNIAATIDGLTKLLQAIK